MLEKSPPRTCIPCEKIEDDCYDWYQRHTAKLVETRKNHADILFIGDSITHFWNGEECCAHGAAVWKKYYGQRKVLNLGFGFDRTQNMLWRIQHGEIEGQNPQAIVVNAGTNQFSVTPSYSGDSPGDAAEGVLALIGELRNRFPTVLIVVMAVFPRTGMIGNKPIQRRIDRLNSILKNALRGKRRVRFLDIGARFLRPDGTPDPSCYVDGGCHPNEKGYAFWAEALEEILQNALKKNTPSV